jgi:hypothetical protein
VEIVMIRLDAKRRDRQGQALIIIAFSMVVLLGIGALVVDIGLSWMLRRQEQNAADPGAIAAARYIEEGDTQATRDKMHAAACFYAQQNGFFVSDNTTCDTAREGTGELQVLWPPSGPHAGNFAGRPEMVLVVIRSQHPSFFGRIFGQSAATVVTGAVAARETTSANSNSLVALDPHSCAAGQIHGNGTVVIEPVDNPETGQPYSGGYVHVNSDCGGPPFDTSCGSGQGALKKSGNAGSLLQAPHVYVHGTCQVAGGTMTSPLTEGASPIGDPLAHLIGPRQELYSAGQCPRPNGTYAPMTPSSNGCAVNRNSVTLTPGVYWGGWKFSGNGTRVTLQPGIYIIAGGGIDQAGSSTIDTVGDGSGNPARVLIFSTDNTMDPACADDTALAASGNTGWEARCVQGHIKMAGQSSMLLAGLDSGPWRGLLMWQDGRGSNPTAPIDLAGQGALEIAGTMYAPKAHVKITGNGSETGILAIQVISWTWQIGGNGDLYMPYDPTELYRIMQRGLVH